MKKLDATASESKNIVLFNLFTHNLEKAQKYTFGDYTIHVTSTDAQKEKLTVNGGDEFTVVLSPSSNHLTLKFDTGSTIFNAGAIVKGFKALIKHLNK